MHASIDKLGKRGLDKKPIQKGSMELFVVQRSKKHDRLMVPISFRGLQGVAAVYTGSSFTLLRESLWKRVTLLDEVPLPSGKQRSVIADGTAQPALGKKEFQFTWHGRQLKAEVNVMEDRHLVFPLIFGQDNSVMLASF